jgi:hypothetical protein
VIDESEESDKDDEIMKKEEKIERTKTIKKSRLRRKKNSRIFTEYSPTIYYTDTGDLELREFFKKKKNVKLHLQRMKNYWRNTEAIRAEFRSDWRNLTTMLACYDRRLWNRRQWCNIMRFFHNLKQMNEMLDHFYIFEDESVLEWHFWRLMDANRVIFY